VSRYRRWNDLLELLTADGQLTVERAAHELGVSAATVRCDVDDLAAQQMLTRIRGGTVAQAVTSDLPLRYKSERHPSANAVVGATAHHEGEASINRLMARRAARLIVTADSSKVGRRAFAGICAAADVDVPVTDAGIEQGQADRLTEAGVAVVIA
jgi:DeoR/GlpR family transcriptional regulator of sugar metabolism